MAPFYLLTVDFCILSLGTLPTWLGDLSGLTELRLDYNYFGGTVPSTLAQLTALKVSTTMHTRYFPSPPSHLFIHPNHLYLPTPPTYLPTYRFVSMPYPLANIPFSAL